MRKYLTVAAVVAMAACGEKKAETPAADAAAAATATVDTMVQKADSTMGAMADSMKAGAPDTSKTVIQKAADAMSAPADSVNRKMEKNPATPPKN